MNNKNIADEIYITFKEWPIIYSKIYALWKNENNSEELTKIESEFFKKISLYIKELHENRNKTKNQIVSALINQQLDNLSYIIKEIYKLRLKKSFNLIMNRKLIEKEKLCLEELDIFNTLTEILGNYLNTLDLLIKGETPQKMPYEPLNGDYFVIRFLKEVPPIIGADLKQYGPFKIDDIAVLPKENVKTLLDHQAVVIIKKK
ncbi:MAG: DNA replication complex subunit Gins51 [Candidatus Helarchaeota archaeon]